MITGANGFSGRHACEYFHNVGYNVIAVTREIVTLKNPEVRYEICDLTDKKRVYSLIQKTKPDLLLHLAGQNYVPKSWNNPISTIESNVMSTAYLIEALRIEKPSCKILVSGSALQFDPTDLSSLLHPYSLSKTLQMIIAQAWQSLYGMDIITAKPTNLIGPGVSNGVCSILANKVVNMERNLSEKVLEVNNLLTMRDFLDVRDAISAYDTLFKQGISGEVYDISSGKSRYLKDITDALKQLTTIDFTVKTVNDKPEILEAKPCFLLKSMGWSPIIQFEDSMKSILAYYRDR